MRTFRIFLAAVLATWLSVGAVPARGVALTPGLYDNETGSPLLPVILATKKTLDIAIYTMTDTAVLQALHQALARKIRVRVIKEPEPVGDTPCRVFAAPIASEEPSCGEQRKLKDAIIASGGSYVPFEKKAFCPDPTKYCFLHGKLVVADQQAALVSTGNFDGSNLCDPVEHPKRCNRDYTYLTADPITVRALATIFEGDLGRRSYNLPAILSGSVAQRLTVSPYSLAPLVQFIRSAKANIRIANQYLWEPHLNQALVDAAKRGVRIDLLVASACAFQPPTPKDQERVKEVFSAFDGAGIRSRMFTSSQLIKGVPGYLHAKAILVDNQRAWVGSVNGSSTAFNNNREFGLFVEDRPSIVGLASRFDADFASAGTESWQESLRCLKDKAAP